MYCGLKTRLITAFRAEGTSSLMALFVSCPVPEVRERNVQAFWRLGFLCREMVKHRFPSWALHYALNPRNDSSKIRIPLCQTALLQIPARPTSVRRPFRRHHRQLHTSEVSVSRSPRYSGKPRHRPTRMSPASGKVCITFSWFLVR